MNIFNEGEPLIQNEPEPEDPDNIEMDNDADSDMSEIESDFSEDEFFEEMHSELIELVTRSTEHLKYLQKSFNNFKSELLDAKRIWYLKFFKEIEIANDTIEKIEDELDQLSD